LPLTYHALLLLYMPSRNKEKFWECINPKCGNKLAKVITHNNVELYNEKGGKFLVNFLRIVITCPKCDTQQVKISPLFYEVVELLKKDSTTAEENINQKINLKLHGITSLDSFYEIFPPKSVKLNRILKNRLKLSDRERRAYEIMVEGENNKTPRSGVIKSIAKNSGFPEKEAELLYSKVMGKIKEAQNEHLKGMGGKLVSDDNWWQLD